MFKIITTKTFSTVICLSLTLASLVFIFLVWNRFDNLASVESEHILHQNRVFLIKDVRFDIVQIQQFLTDASLTRRQQEIQAATTHFEDAKAKLDALSHLQADIQPECEQLKQHIGMLYETGIRMTTIYLTNDIPQGNTLMTDFDGKSEQLTNNLNKLVLQLDAELQQAVDKNAKTIDRNFLILIASIPIVLGFFCGLLLKVSRLLKQQMIKLQAKTTQLNTVLETAASAIITINEDGLIQSFNRSAERIFGYDPSAIIGKHITTLLPAAEAILQEISHSKTSIAGRQRELDGLRNNGELFPVQLRINPMLIDGTLFFSAFIDDISETRQLQNQLMQSQKLEAIGQMATGVAHEINTPIQYIGDNLSALTENFNDIIAFQKEAYDLADADLKAKLSALDDKYDMPFILDDSPKALQQSLKGVTRVVEIIKAMKAFSHMDSNYGKQTVNLHETLLDALIFAKSAYRNIAEIETDFSNELDSIECYPNELNQVFLNLIINATHAIEEKQAGQGMGLIRLVTHKRDELAEILIQDNGAGIAPEIQQKVFNLFFTTKEVGKGTGQGLSLSHSIVVDKHHGKLFLESTLGVGTTFHIHLPIKQPG